MSSTFGTIYRITTWGESHGKAIGCIVDGCPSGLKLSEKDIQSELDRRRPGKDLLGTARKEEDKVEILSGVFEGRTLGTPISMVIQNLDADSSKYRDIKDLLRPGQAEHSWREKYGFIDWRGGGRASGRETASRVAGGAIAKKLLSQFDIDILAYSKEIAGITADISSIDPQNLEKTRRIIASNPARSPDMEVAGDMEHAILSARKDKDSVGGIIEAVATGVPAGLGEPLFDKLSSDIARALMSIPAVKGVEIGAGFELARMRGSRANDPFMLEGGQVKTSANNAGGILGGISNGMPVIARVAVKPTASIAKTQETVDYKRKKKAEIQVHGRHDPCIVPRAVPVVEAMLAMVIADHSLISGFIPRSLGAE
ncbi:MAG: chorismate synthase [Candidatus Altiarchaeota archaeon]|nr:chorismate synthase [Candidatus Altiarchaeota archaeon]